MAALVQLRPADGFTEVTARPEQFEVPAVSTFTLRGSGGEKAGMVIWLKGSRMGRDEFDVGLVLPALNVSVSVAKDMEERVARFQSLEGQSDADVVNVKRSLEIRDQKLSVAGVMVGSVHGVGHELQPLKFHDKYELERRVEDAVLGMMRGKTVHVGGQQLSLTRESVSVSHVYVREQNVCVLQIHCLPGEQYGVGAAHEIGCVWRDHGEDGGKGVLVVGSMKLRLQMGKESGWGQHITLTFSSRHHLIIGR